MTQALISDLAGATLDDIYLIGLLKEGASAAQFCPQLRLLYLEVSGKLLELRCVEDTGTLMLKPVAEFSAVPWNADNSPACTMSIRDMVLTDADGTNQIASITLLGPDFRPESVACAAVQLELDNGQVIFFDPSYYFGIRIGGSEQRSIWLDNAPGAESIQEWTSQQVDRSRR